MDGVISTNVRQFSLDQIFFPLVMRDYVSALVPIIVLDVRISYNIFKHFNIFRNDTSMDRVLPIIKTHKWRKMEINHEEIHEFHYAVISSPVENSGKCLLFGVHFVNAEIFELDSFTMGL